MCVCVRVNSADMTAFKRGAHQRTGLACAVNKHNLAKCLVKSQDASQRLNRPPIIRAASGPTSADNIVFCQSAVRIMSKVGRVSKGH